MRGLRSIRAAAVVVIVLAVSPASAGSFDPTANDALTMGRALLDAARTDRPSSILANTLRTQGLHVATASAPSIEPPGTPRAVAAAAGRLIGAARAAETLRAQATARLTPAERAAVLDGLRVSRPATDAGTGQTSILAVNTLEPHPAAAAIAAKVDEAALRSAAAIVLRAIEDDAPGFAALGDVPLVPSNCGAGGDMVYESGDCQIMIGGAGDNTYGDPIDPLLLIDVGGNDMYTNQTAVANSEVRIVLDLAGDDVYARASSTDAPGGPLAMYGQGVGAIGIGVLADLGGDDSYSVATTTTAPDPGPVAAAAAAIGQGVGIVGAGVLVDVGGVNTFSVTASSTGGAVLANGQGAATGGVGALISITPSTDDAGGDTYLVSGTSTLHRIEENENFARFSIGDATIGAQGATDLAGAGLLVDTGGDDTYDAVGTGASAQTIAQGGSWLGAGVLVDADGDDTLNARSIGDARLSLITTNPSVCWTGTVVVNTSATEAVGHGGTDGGLAVLADGGGDDARTLEAHSRAEATTIVTSDFACEEFGGNKATATARTGDGRALGQGAGQRGVGLLADIGGNDADRLFAFSEAHATAQAFAPGPIGEAPSATPGEAEALGQAFTSIGVGVSANVSGDDRYSATSTIARCSWTSRGPTLTTPDREPRRPMGRAGATRRTAAATTCTRPHCPCRPAACSVFARAPRILLSCGRPRSATGGVGEGHRTGCSAA